MSQTPTARGSGDETSPRTPEAPVEEKSFLDKIATAIPIGITALATVFAGMANGELQRAMFWRTAAGQDQARATNQWTLAGFKRSRALKMEGTATSIEASAGDKFGTFSPPAELAEWFKVKGPARVKLPDHNDEIKELLKAIKDRMSEEDILKIAAKVKPADINKSIDDLAAFNAKLDDEWDKKAKAARALAKKSKDAAAKVAWLETEEGRYRSETFLEQSMGYLYDARVRVVTAVSDKHRKRSENFFFAMLAGQIGGVVAALALSKKTSTALWSIALLLGFSAVGYGGFVHLAF